MAETLATNPAPRFLPLFVVALAIRGLVVGLGILIVAQNPGRQPPDEFQAQMYADVDADAAWPVEPWYRSDALWMVRVAKHGYAGATGPGGQHGAAFLPFLPASLAAAAFLGLNIYWVGVLLPNLAAAAGLAVFARLAARLTGDRATGIRAFVLLNAFPPAFFFSAPYQESIGMLFTALALSAWHAGRSGARVGMFAGLGCVARVTCTAIGAAAVSAWLIDGPRTRRGFWRAFAVAAGCAVGVLIGWTVLWVAVNDPFLATKSHAGWGRRSPSFANILVAFQSVNNPDSPQWFSMAHVLLLSALGVVAWVRRGAFWGLVTIIPALQLASTGTFLSGHRVMLVCLPGFIELAALLRNRLAFLAVTTIFAAVQLLLIRNYVLWGFAG